jgi:hypothetical protein
MSSFGTAFGRIKFLFIILNRVLNKETLHGGSGGTMHIGDIRCLSVAPTVPTRLSLKMTCKNI